MTTAEMHVTEGGLTKVQRDTGAKSCFEDAKTYPGNHEPGLVEGGGLGVDVVSTAFKRDVKRRPTMSVEQMPQPIAAEPKNSRGGKSLARMVAGTGHRICSNRR
jgi:hypothetical protein